MTTLPEPPTPLRSIQEPYGLILDEGVKAHASDLMLRRGHPPLIRTGGEWTPMTFERLKPDDILAILREIHPKGQRADFEDTLAAELGADFRTETSLSRYRGSVGFENMSPYVILRPVSQTVPTLDDLHLRTPGHASTLKRLAELKRGLVLVTGPTGSGKSTTLAAMINHINRSYRRHVITIEQPIEYVYRSEKSVINQREVGFDTHSFADALRAALRQAPDVILVGEVRDEETARTTLQAAETGHLVFATLHTKEAASTIARLISFFPGDEQPSVRTQLADTLAAVVSQQLVPLRRPARESGLNRQLVCEIMQSIPAMRSVIKDEKKGAQQIREGINTSREIGNALMDVELAEAVRADLISPEAGFYAAVDRERYRQNLSPELSRDLPQLEASV